MKDSYKHLLFQEEGINIIEMKYNAEQNKLLDEKNYAIENANILNTYYNSVITLQKEEMNRLTTEVEELWRSKILKENRGLLYEVKQAQLEEEGRVSNKVIKEMQELSIMNMNVEGRQYKMNRCSLLYHNNKEKELLDRKKMNDIGKSDRNTNLNRD